MDTVSLIFLAGAVAAIIAAGHSMRNPVSVWFLLLVTVAFMLVAFGRG